MIEHLKLETREDLLVALLPDHVKLAPAMLNVLERYGETGRPQNLESYLVGLYIEALEREIIKQRAL